MRRLQRAIGLFLANACLLLSLGSQANAPDANPWPQWRTEIQANPKQAEQTIQAELAQLPASTSPSLPRTILEIRLLSAQLAQGQDAETQLTRLRELADSAALLGDMQAAMHAWRECSRRYFLKGDYRRAQAAAQHMLDAARQIGARKDEAQALNDLGVLAKRRGDIRNAIIHYENALGIRRAIADDAGVAQTLSNLALIEKNRGSLLKALGYQREAHAIRARLGQPAQLASSHDSLGLIYLAMGDAEEAERQFRAALAAGDLPNNQDNISNSRNNLSLALLKQGRVDEAESLARQVYDHALQRKLKPHQVSAATSLSAIARRRGELDAAGKFAEEALLLGREVGDSKEIIEPLLERAEWQLARSNLIAAEADLSEALSLSRRDQYRLLEYQAIELQSRILLARGDAEAAFVARQEYERIGQELLGADTLRRMAELLTEGASARAAAPAAEAPAAKPWESSRGLLLLAVLVGWVLAKIRSGRSD